MSEFKTCFTPILSINPHPNPKVERLEVATVYGFQVIIGKGKHLPGDFLLYVPVDSILPADLEALVFPEGSKIKLHNSRVKQIRIQQFPSQGMLIEVETIRKLLEQRGLRSVMDFKLNHDYQELLGIKKYEPPVPEFQKPGNKTTRNKPLENSNFHKYNGIDNLKWFPDLFKEDEEVVIQEKLHGSNCRAGIVPTQANTLWKKLKKLVGMLPSHEFVYGSNNVELTNRSGYKGYYGQDVYGAVLAKVEAKDKIKPGEQIFGELIGPGIQKGYDYGHKEHAFVLFDVKAQQEDGSWKWLSPEEVSVYAYLRGFETVPVLYDGLYNKAVANELVGGPSSYDSNTKVREGIVIKSKNKYHDPMCANNKRVLKNINPAYLDKDQSDFH